MHYSQEENLTSSKKRPQTLIFSTSPSQSWYTDYLRHAPCMREVQSGYERCADEYQMRIKNLNQNSAAGNEAASSSSSEEEESDENVELLCCSFQEYLHCSESIVNSTCGHETARFTKSFLDRMSGPLIQVRGICEGGYMPEMARLCLPFYNRDTTLIYREAKKNSEKSKSTQDAGQRPCFRFNIPDETKIQLTLS